MLTDERTAPRLWSIYFFLAFNIILTRAVSLTDVRYGIITTIDLDIQYNTIEQASGLTNVAIQYVRL